MAGPMQMPSTPTSPKAFYIMWVVTLVLAGIVGVVVTYLVLQSQTQKVAQPTQNQEVVGDTTKIPMPNIKPIITEKLSGTVLKRNGASLLTDQYYITKDQKDIPKYNITIDNSTLCLKTIINGRSTTTEAGSCSDIVEGMYITAVSRTEKIDQTFIAKEISYSKENPFGSKFPLE